VLIRAAVVQVGRPTFPTELACLEMI